MKRLDNAREGRMHPARYIHRRLLAEIEAGFITRRGDTHEPAHGNQPLGLIVPLHIAVTVAGLQSALEAIQHAREYLHVRSRPRLSSAAEAWHEELADEALPLRAAHTVVVHYVAVVEEDVPDFGHRS